MSHTIISDAAAITPVSQRPNIIITYPDGADSSAAERLSETLGREEINIYCESDGFRILRSICPSGSWHMVIITGTSIMHNGFEIIKRIRSFSDIPVMTVSDAEDEIFKIMALSKGADICMTLNNEYGIYELKARVISLLRRSIGPCTCDMGEYTDCRRDILINGSIRIDRKRREFFSGGKKVRLTAIEFGIVEYLMVNCGDVCTVDDIYRHVWNETPYSVRKTVVEHIRRIRCKIEPDPKNPCYIKVVFGIGYKMERAAV